MNLSKALPFVYVSLSVLLAQVPPRGNGNWPREIDTDSIHLVIYQPQVDSWKDNRIDARSAVIVTRKGDPTQNFGIVSISARAEVDRETRLVAFEEIVVKEANFPSAASLQPTLLKAVRESVAGWPQTVSLDRLLADLAITEAETKSETISLRNDPPKIIFSKVPAVLTLIDGEPVYRVLEGTPYRRVVNTPALLLFDYGAGIFYLDGDRWWMTARALNGPWTAAVKPPQDLQGIKRQLTKDEENEPAQTAAVPPEGPPAVYVSTVPAELLVTRGEPAFAPIAATSLLYATNSDDDIFIDTQSQQYYTLIAGRWFRAKSMQGQWDWVAGEQLPRDFLRITPESPKGHVLASIPGTEQAREAVIANQIPQTATVKRSEAKFDAHYEGAPQFRPIEGTGMEYAINTSAEVIHAAGRYYAVQNGVWFVADSPQGPWAVADMVPPEIYRIPPSSPLYHVRYVYVYRSTPDYVYVGYTPGYMGAFVSGGVVVFGTGWRYPGWCSDFYPFYCFGWPWTWGFGLQFSYWGGGWFWHPVHQHWFYHATPAAHRIFYDRWNPQWRFPNRTWIRNNVNVYGRWTGNAVAPRSFQQRGVVSPGARGTGVRPDLYAGRDGQVYQHRQDGWYQRNNSGQWNRAPSNPQLQQRLDQQRQSRSLGQARQREFENRGQGPGIPRTASPQPRPGPQARPAPRQPAPQRKSAAPRAPGHR